MSEVEVTIWDWDWEPDDLTMSMVVKALDELGVDLDAIEPDASYSDLERLLIIAAAHRLV
jgi:hypothetical protein